jgi:hypothetical protein
MLVHAVVPEGFDDAARPSGGNRYDWMVLRGLAARGWDVRLHEVPGSWPWADAAALDELRHTLAAISAGAPVLVDGLLAAPAPDVLVPEADRLRLAVLVHLSLGESPPGHEVPDAAERERAVLCAAAAVLTTSRWTRDRLLARYPLTPTAVRVAEPGVEDAPLSAGSPDGTALLSVAAVTAHKGSDVLVTALTELSEFDWHASWVGALEREPEFAARVQRQAAAGGIGTRLVFAGARTGAALAASYAGADVLVHPSHGESYGMVVAEALAHGLPVIATDVGGVREALGSAPDGVLPGMLVPPGRPDSLAAALRSWLGQPELRTRLRDAARQRRSTLPTWSQTAATVADVLASLR